MSKASCSKPSESGFSETTHSSFRKDQRSLLRRVEVRLLIEMRARDPHCKLFYRGRKHESMPQVIAIENLTGKPSMLSMHSVVRVFGELVEVGFQTLNAKPCW